MNLNKCDSIGIIACSNGIDSKNKNRIDCLEEVLLNLGLRVIYAKTIYKNNSIFNGSNKERAEALMELYTNNNIKAIFDISGGDLANGILEYLDYDLIKKNSKPFFGYSDLSVVLNALYHKVGMPTYHYQLRNIIGKYKEKQIDEFKSTLMDNGNKLYRFNYKWIQGFRMDGVVIGGNIRCFLKLAGTEFMPDFKNKILFLESMSGDIAKMVTYLNQYKQLGAFKKINGILLGTFTEMERKKYFPDIIELVKSAVDDENIPIAKTENIGHGEDSKCIIIGKKLILNKGI